MTSPSGRSRSTWEICASNQSKSRVERVLTFLPGSSRRSQAIPSSKASAPDGAPAWTFSVRLCMGALASMTLIRAIVGIHAAVCQEKGAARLYRLRVFQALHDLRHLDLGLADLAAAEVEELGGAAQLLGEAVDVDLLALDALEDAFQLVHGLAEAQGGLAGL